MQHAWWTQHAYTVKSLGACTVEVTEDLQIMTSAGQVEFIHCAIYYETDYV